MPAAYRDGAPPASLSFVGLLTCAYGKLPFPESLTCLLKACASMTGFHRRQGYSRAQRRWPSSIRSASLVHLRALYRQGVGATKKFYSVFHSPSSGQNKKPAETSAGFTLLLPVSRCLLYWQQRFPSMPLGVCLTYPTSGNRRLGFTVTSSRGLAPHSI